MLASRKDHGDPMMPVDEMLGRKLFEKFTDVIHQRVNDNLVKATSELRVMAAARVAVFAPFGDMLVRFL